MTSRLILIAMAAGPVCAYAHAPVSGNEARDMGAVISREAISPDMKGFGRDGASHDGAWWRPGRGDRPPVASTTPLDAPELGLGFAASSLVLCIGGLAVARGRRTPGRDGCTPELS
jgi:hypothetical protein